MAVMAIYARENGQGMVFELEEPDTEQEGSSSPDPLPPEGGPPRPGGRPSLKVVK
jgi:stringent starvation protein B